MLAQEELDVVSICTSNDAHHPAALAAIERGLHVFCEKPLALNYAQAREMYEAAQSQGVVTRDKLHLPDYSCCPLPKGANGPESIWRSQALQH